MDAKIRKAAVSAAIKVTMSTALLGCGGSVTSNGGAAGADNAGAQPTASGQSSPAKAPSEPASGGYPQIEPTSAGTPATSASAGGAPLGGVTSSAGTGGSSANAGGTSGNGGGARSASAAGEAGTASERVCGGSQVDACLTQLAQSTSGQPLSDAGKACCQTVLTALTQRQLSAVCQDEVSTRFMQAPTRTLCCSDPQTWQEYPACTPWGPPVPPELSLATLQKWQAAA